MEKILNAIKEDIGIYILCVLLSGCFEVGLLNISILYLANAINPSYGSIVSTVLSIMWLPLSIILGSLEFFEIKK